MSHAPEPYYLAFIDEAGDPGLNTVRPIDAAGGTEWLCLGAVVIRAARGAEILGWVRSILLKAGGNNRSDLHYRTLPNFRKRIVCSELAKLPIRAFVLASNKKNMRRYRNPRAERIGSQQWFYNYCLRLLLERVTHFCYQKARSEGADDRFLKIIYRGPRIIAVAGNFGDLWGEQHRIETRTKPNHSWVKSGRLTIGGNYSRSPIVNVAAIPMGRQSLITSY
jgi:hypothetical protein